MDRTLVLALLVCITGSVAAQAYFADDFNDNYIGDWEQRCGSGAWGASGGCATVTTGYTCSALVCPGDLVAEDLVLQTSGTATHVLGFVARLVEGDNGIYAYVSPDHDVARIRLVQGGVASTILGSLTAPYPSGVTYHLTLTCAGPSLSLLIQVPSSGQQWSLSVTDPGPQEGEFGIAAGDEPGASFDWMECTYEASLQVALFSETTDDDMQGQSAGDGDGAFESGEQIELNLGIQNQGSAAMTGAYAVLQSLSSSIVVVGNYGSYGTMQPGETSTASGDFVINAVPFAPMPATHPMRLTVFADGGFSQQLDFDIPLGSGLSCDVESGYSEWVHAAAQPGWGDNWHVSSARNHTSGGAQSFKCGDIGGGGLRQPPLVRRDRPLVQHPSQWLPVVLDVDRRPDLLDRRPARAGRWADPDGAVRQLGRRHAPRRLSLRDRDGIDGSVFPWHRRLLGDIWLAARHSPLRDGPVRSSPAALPVRQRQRGNARGLVHRRHKRHRAYGHRTW